MGPLRPGIRHPGSARSLAAVSRGALRQSLAAAIPLQIAGLMGRELTLPESDRRAAGVSAYLLRSYAPVGAASQVPPVSLYVGFYERQGQGKTIHSPKNCLPGAGWEPLSSRTATLATARGGVGGRGGVRRGGRGGGLGL